MNIATDQNHSSQPVSSKRANQSHSPPVQGKSDDSFRREWIAVALAFVVAASAGIFMRFALVSGQWYGLDFGHVRHAHSHLMLFSWGTSAWMVLLVQMLWTQPSINDNQRRVLTILRRCAHWSIAMGFVAFVPFLLWGYRLVQVGGARLPVTIILATTIIFIWYFFAFYWVRYRRLMKEPNSAVLLLDLSVISMIACTVGAWLRAVFTAIKIADPIYADSAVNSFLTIMTDGWLVLGIFGLVAFQNKIEIRKSAVIAAGISLLLSFLVNLPGVADWLRSIGAVFMFVYAVSAISIIMSLRSVISPIVVFAFMAAFALRILYVIPPVMHFIDDLQLRITYLHWLYLACVSSLLLELFRAGSRLRLTFFASAVLLVMGTLPATRLWTVLGLDGWRHEAMIFMIISSFGPPLVMVSLLLLGRSSKVLSRQSKFYSWFTQEKESTRLHPQS